MNVSRLPVIAFVLAVVLTTSTVAAAGWIRVNTGTGSGNYGAGGQGCLVASSGVYGGANVWACPLPNDSSALTGYTSATAYFSNSNTTQPVAACVTYYNASGGTCSNSANNNCPSAGVCSFNLDITAWTNNTSHFKYVLFDKLTVGARVSGYVLNYNP